MDDVAAWQFSHAHAHWVHLIRYASLGISLTQLLDGKRKGVMRWVGSKQASCIDGDPSFHTLWWLSNIFKLVNRACSCQLLFASFEISSQLWNNRYSMLHVVVIGSLILDLFVFMTGADRKPGSGWRNKPPITFNRDNSPFLLHASTRAVCVTMQVNASTEDLQACLCCPAAWCIWLQPATFDLTPECKRCAQWREKQVCLLMEKLQFVTHLLSTT